MIVASQSCYSQIPLLVSCQHLRDGPLPAQSNLLTSLTAIQVFNQCYGYWHTKVFKNQESGDALTWKPLKRGMPILVRSNSFNGEMNTTI
jgi:hypothetical protein